MLKQIIQINKTLMKKISLPIVTFFISQFIIAQVQVSNLLCENLSNPIGLDVAQPRFSWQLVSDKRNVTQTAYEIKVTAGRSKASSSGKINSDSSVHVVYKGSALQSGI